jgi:phosphotriesterase-related protein
VHTHPASRSGLVAIGVLAQEGADLTRVVIGHSGDTDDLDYLAEVADAGCLLGMDRFGDTDPAAFGQRVKTVAGMCERGYAASMVLSHDTACFIDWFPHDDAMAGNYTHIHDHVLPALAELGVTAGQIETMLVTNPRRYFTPPP